MSGQKLCQVQPTNSGLSLLDTPRLRRARSAYRRLLHQIKADPGAEAIAELNVRAYVREIDEELARRESSAAAA